MNSQRAQGFLCSESHYEAARKIAVDGIVLLKNKNLLPLNVSKAKRILVVGENAIKPMTVGGGSSSLKVQREVSPFDGLKAALADVDGLTLDFARGYVGDTTSFYNGVKMHVDLTEDRPAQELINEAVQKAKGADYVIVFGGLNKSDFQDCEGPARSTTCLMVRINSSRRWPVPTRISSM